MRTRTRPSSTSTERRLLAPGPALSTTTLPAPSLQPSGDAPPPTDEVVEDLRRMQAGDAAARSRVFSRFYGELRATAGAIMRGSASGTFQPSDLVHGAYLKLLGTSRPWESRKHFLDVAADAMLHVLIDHVRERKTRKRGGGAQRTDLDDAMERCITSLEDRGIAMLDLCAALERLEEDFADAARFAKLRLVAGLDVPRVCEVMGMPQRSGERLWRLAKHALRQHLQGWEPPAA